ncbi:phosphopantetheine-binding protein [Streptomyces sp. NEAU-S7GS2]|uniref:phosphopantetheine-binding protein n=1 Tax=Streptomyces sp. NEAU-S7GS2 TaxID=2202000 RepID=UPI000D6F264C|nr:phosphopantetheine-binding protein [Streptomyces sp. NEAU-S7GS2]AWN27780.1 acyl carrier protein [Streptomyces sp. NEAU-S7GS2]
MTETEFLTLLDEDLGLRLSVEDLSRDVDTLLHWDSMQLVRLLSVLEARTGKSIALTTLLEARTLNQARKLVMANA